MELTNRMHTKEMAQASSVETDGNINTSDDQKSLNEVKVVKRQTRVKQPRVKNLLQAIVGIKMASTVYRYSQDVYLCYKILFSLYIAE